MVLKSEISLYQRSVIKVGFARPFSNLPLAWVFYCAFAAYFQNIFS